MPRPQNLIFKPRPNDLNISTQHTPTLLAQHLQAPAKRSQQLKATYPNIVVRVWPPCCDVLRHFGF